jgi:hypothetical protein
MVILSLLLTCAAAQAGDGGGKPPADDEWRERSAGFLVSRPDIRLSTDNAGRLSADARMKPGSGILIKPARAAAAPITGIDLSVKSDGCNTSSLDYKPGSARFPFSVTLVFGKERQDMGWGARIALIFGRMWDGLPASGIRLTYAWACRAPVGSMFRLTDEETVFVIAGIDEAGKRIGSKREAAADFRAAYGRQPAGSVTDVVVRLDRPSKEKGDLGVSFDLKLTP